MQVLDHVHRHTGMPYAWQGAHADWMRYAKRQQWRCSIGDTPTGDTPIGDRSHSCQCFLEYMYEHNQTAEGLWACSDNVHTPRYNAMLRQVMPNATWITTVREPTEHLVASFKVYQAPNLKQSSSSAAHAQPQQQQQGGGDSGGDASSDASSDAGEDECRYSGFYADGSLYTSRLGLACFADLFVDPQLRHCATDPSVDQASTLAASQLCSMGFDATPTSGEIASRYDLVLPSEDPITPLLAKLHVEWGVPIGIVKDIHAEVEEACESHAMLGANDVKQSEAEDDKWQRIVDAPSSQAKLINLSDTASESFRLHLSATAEAARLRGEYRLRTNLTAACWPTLYPSPPAKGIALARAMPHTRSERLLTFDNANYVSSNVRLDRCLPGLPETMAAVSQPHDGAPAGDTQQANALLSQWLTSARTATPCFNCTGYATDLRGKVATTGYYVPAHKMEFYTAAKVASQTVSAWMACRFKAYAGQSRIGPDFTRAMLVRDPVGRAKSGFYQVLWHYMLLLKLPPEELRSCARAWPTGVDDVTGDPLIWNAHSKWPPLCRKAWTANAFGQPLVRGRLHVIRSEVVATAESSLLRAIWELPAGCRVVWTDPFPDPNKTDGSMKRNWTNWLCDEKREACYDNCAISDDQMATLFSHALSDAAKSSGVVGCGNGLFGGEHMWPQARHLAVAARADAVLRLEDVEGDVGRFEAYLEQKEGGRKLPPASENCSFAALHANEEGTQGGEVHEALTNSEQLERVLRRSPDLTRRLCALYYHDFVCNSYELPAECQGAPDEWLGGAFMRS